jgi:hypothetical protein
LVSTFFIPNNLLEISLQTRLGEFPERAFEREGQMLYSFFAAICCHPDATERCLLHQVMAKQAALFGCELFGE